MRNGFCLSFSTKGLLTFDRIDDIFQTLIKKCLDKENNYLIITDSELINIHPGILDSSASELKLFNIQLKKSSNNEYKVSANLMSWSNTMMLDLEYTIELSQSSNI